MAHVDAGFSVSRGSTSAVARKSPKSIAELLVAMSAES